VTYATNGPAWIAWGVGGGDQHGYNSTNSGVAKTMLRILTGNVDNYGGEYHADPGIVEPDGTKRFPMRDAELELSEVVTPEMREKFLGNNQFRMMSWPGFQIGDACYRKMWNIPRPMLHQLLVAPTLAWDAILTGKPYPVKAMIAWGSNPLAWAPNTKHVYAALKELELLVVSEYWKTPTAALADYILPAADSLERPIATTNEDAFDLFLTGDRMSQPLADRRSDYDMFRGLGIRLGQAEQWPWERYEDAIAHRFERTGLSYKEVVEAGVWMPGELKFWKYATELPNGQIKGFATPSRKAEIFSSTLQDIDYDPIVQIQTTDARTTGIRDGDWIWIETPRGRVRQRAKLEFGLKRGTVIAQPSWWFPELPAEEPWSQGIFESNGNVLTDDAIETLDEAGGQWVTRGLLCKVYPCIDGRDRIDIHSNVEDFIDDVQDEFFHEEYQHLGFAEVKRLQ
jgi:anaerobic selenocysteine-containing dehydrogenase